MDVRRHGNPEWQQKSNHNSPAAQPTPYAKAEDGKTEMSLLHFTLTNPDWKPPQEEQTHFIKQIRSQVTKEAEILITRHNLPALEEENVEQHHLEQNVLLASLNSLEAAGGVYSELANGIMADAGIMRSPSHFLHQRSPTPNQGNTSIRSAFEGYYFFKFFEILKCYKSDTRPRNTQFEFSFICFRIFNL